MSSPAGCRGRSTGRCSGRSSSSESRWDPEQVIARRLGLLLSDPATAPYGGGVLVIDGSGDREDGTKTVHVGRQWLGQYGPPRFANSRKLNVSERNAEVRLTAVSTKSWINYHLEEVNRIGMSIQEGQEIYCMRKGNHVRDQSAETLSVVYKEIL